MSDSDGGLNELIHVKGLKLFLTSIKLRVLDTIIVIITIIIWVSLAKIPGDKKRR